MCEITPPGPEANARAQAEHGPSQLLGFLPEAPLTETGKVWAGTATVRTTADMEAVLDVLVDALRRNSFSQQEIFGIHLALSEAIVNAVKHGHGGDSSKQVRIRYLINYVGLLAQVEDEGPGFVQARVLDPLAAANLHRDSGRGLLLMRSYMTEVRYNNVGNCVTLVKRRPVRDGNPN